MARVISVFLPLWPVDRLRRQDGTPSDRPLVLAGRIGNRRVVTAVDALAKRASPGTRQVVKMAGLVEDSRWRVPQGKGPDRRYMMADLTDQSGKWGATCFNAEGQEALAAALTAGEALLLDVELQWREGDESPRLTIQNAVPLNALVKSVRALLTIELGADAKPDLVPQLVAWLPRGGRSAVEAMIPMAGGGRARLLLGQDFLLPAGAEAAIAEIAGVSAARIEAMNQSLRLVA